MMTREQSVEVAKRYLGTPYVLGGQVPGAGLDCATLLIEYLIEIGACERESIPWYSADWFHNTTEDRYKFALLKHARQIAETVAIASADAKPGDLVLLRVARSRIYNHGAIVTEWPHGIHAFDGKVRRVNLAIHALTSRAEMAIFSPWKD